MMRCEKHLFVFTRCTTPSLSKNVNFTTNILVQLTIAIFTLRSSHRNIKAVKTLPPSEKYRIIFEHADMYDIFLYAFCKTNKSLLSVILF